MLTRADELRNQIAGLDGMIADEEKEIAARLSRVEAIRKYIAHLQKRRAGLESELAREEAPLVRPQPTSVKAGCFDI